MAHYTDNVALVFILGSGSNKPKLQKMCKEIILSLRKIDISLVPNMEIKVRKSLNLVKNVFDNFSFDGFASAPTAICDKFYSQFSTCGSSGVKFFYQVLSVEEHYLICPPLYLAINSIKHLALCKTKGVIIVPIWPQSSWVNFFFGKHCASWVNKMCSRFAEGKKLIYWF